MIEKVNPCHPDKVADRIAGAIVDLAYSKVENPEDCRRGVARPWRSKHHHREQCGHLAD